MFPTRRYIQRAYQDQGPQPILIILHISFYSYRFDMGRPSKKLVPFMMMFSAIVGAAAASPNCRRRCGNLEIPYPFGIEKGCYLNDAFFIICNKTHIDRPKAFLGDSNLEVINISINGELQILHYVAEDCHERNGSIFSNEATLWLTNFTISNTKNKFIAMGCDTWGNIYGTLKGYPFRSGCMAFCENEQIVIDGPCSGNGCCQLEIPKGLKDLNLEVRSFKNHTEVLNFNPCGYAFVIEQHNFTFLSKYIHKFAPMEVPLALDWAIKNDTCSTADNKTNCNNVCGPNTKKINFLNDGSEYRCQCFDGYKGNPCLTDDQGCQDIDECKDKSHNCKDDDQCVNTPGNYTCNCPKYYKRDGRPGRENCIPNFKAFWHIIIGTGVGLLVLIIGGTWLYLSYKRWKFIHQKEKFFKRNGGSMLQEHLSQWQSHIDMLKIFSQEELEKATNNYDESAVVGKGGYGTVYKGVLDDGQIIAIKKSKLADQSQTDQFINEVIVLSQINHRNVVKLLGCCLETQVPLLVYEFVTNGTLYEHIHDKTKHVSLSWETRLKIASETASVLSYLHSSASTPIIHRDIKSTNILLDNNYTAKVSDFGASKLVPLDHTQISTMVQGTLGYLDPEYLLTSELTEKSDVYSFGIVLLELITGKKAVRFDGPEEERNLAMYVLSAMKEDRLEEVVEKEMITEEIFGQIKEVAKLAKECVRVKGEERPTMKEVAMELEGVRLMQVHEHFNLLDGASDSSSIVVSGNMDAMDHTIKGQILSNIPHGR